MRLFALTTFLAILVATAAACGGGGGSSSLPTTMEVRQGDDVLATWDAARMRADLTMHEFSFRSTTYEGPLLADLIAASGSAEWANVVVHGKGPNLERDVAPLVLRENSERDGFVVAINSDGTFRLVMPGAHDSSWVRRVSALVVGS